MFLLLSASVGNLLIGDIIFTLLYFLFVIGILVALVVLFVKYKKRGNRLQRIEEKLNELLADKEEGN